jgi:hypothetical protein
MRCLYCGIRLKIAVEAQVIKYCPECSLRAEREDRRALFIRAEKVNRSVNTGGERRAFSAKRSA